MTKTEVKTFNEIAIRNLHLALIDDEIKHCLKQMQIISREIELLHNATEDDTPKELVDFQMDRLEHYGNLIRKRADILGIEPDYKIA